MTLSTDRIRALQRAATPPPWTLSADRRSIVQTRHKTRDVWTIPRHGADMDLIAAVHDIADAATDLQARYDALRQASAALLDVNFSDQEVRLLLVMGDGRTTPTSTAIHARIDALSVAQAALRALLDPDAPTQNAPTQDALPEP